MGIVLLSGVEEVGDSGISRDIFCNIIPGVVCSHLLLIGKLLKDIAKHIRVYLVIIPLPCVIEMPMPLAKERKNTLKRLVRDLNIGICFLQLVFFEQTSI